MHRSVQAYVSECVQKHGLAECSVLDIGSLDVNGSCRSLFTGRYWGIDMREGPGVDEIVNAHDLAATRGREYDVVLCLEMLEHDSEPWETLRNAHAITLRGGWLVLTCRGYDERGCFPVHDHPDDLFRYSVNAIRGMLRGAGWQPLDVRPDPEAPGVFALARRP